MPAPPEIGDAGGHVWQVEVGRAGKAHHLAQTVAHLRIAGKIEIQLQRIGEDAQPGQRQGSVGEADAVRGDDIGPQRADRIGKDDLFRQAENKLRRALLGLAHCTAPARRVQGRGHVTVTHDRPDDQLREKDNVGGKVDRVALRFCLAGVYVRDIADEFEYVIADAKRQYRQKCQGGQPQPGDLIERVDQEICVFEKDQRGRADGDGQHQHKPAPARLAPPQKQPGQIVDQNQHGDQRQPGDAGPAVKEDAFQQKDRVFGAPGRKIIQQQCQRHKTEQKHDAVEHHIMGHGQLLLHNTQTKRTAKNMADCARPRRACSADHGRGGRQPAL